jgi:thiopeptide-type bacteriocin biosynthesis protein
MEITAQGFFMLRRPVFPLETLFDFNERARKAPALFEQELISVFSQPLPSEALFTASPGLYHSFQALKEGRLNSGREKLLMTLYKYLVRMCSRATPYGLFAGIASGTLSPSTNIKFAEDAALKKHTRLDMYLLSEISSNFQKKEYIRSLIRFFPNTSLYLLDDCYRYIERVKMDNGYQYVLSAVEASVSLERVLAVSSEGCTIQQMVESLRGELPLEQAHDFVNAIIEAQLLCSELDLNVTGTLFQDLLSKKLNELGASSEAIILENFKMLTGPAANLETLLELQNLTENHFPQLTNYNTVQTDLQFETRSCQLGQRCIDILAKEFEQVRHLLQGQPATDLDSFKQAFFRRYENREVPLLTALDNESGIGFGVLIPGSSDLLPLLDELNLCQQTDHSATSDYLGRFKEELFERALMGRTIEVELSDVDFANFQKKLPLQTDGFYWLGSLIADSQHAVDQGNFKFVLKATGGPSGLELMGRFSHADQQLNSYLKASASQQQHPDCILAEIAHLPEPRTANILQRSHIREYEIVFLSGSCLPMEHQIQPSDLMVSVPNGKEIILRSRRLNKRVIPRMTTAHNFSQGLPLYRFLCELSSPQSGSLQSWDWGPCSNRLFLPRIRYKHWILTRASWIIDKSHYKAIFERKSNFEAEWGLIRQNMKLPRYLLISQGDNELLIDCDNTVSLALLKDIFSRQQNIKLTECLDQPGQGILHDKGKSFTNEIVVPFRMNSFLTMPSWSVISTSTARQPTKNFAVGSAWLYTKIYIGTKSADHLLSQLIKPFCEALISTNKIEKWFFIRYQDPMPHLRIRFYHGKKPDFWHSVLGALSDILNNKMGSGNITSLQTDTYHREIERYHGLEIEQTESIFYADSLAVLDLLEIIGSEDEHLKLRWQAGLAGTDRLINDFGFTASEKLELIQDVYNQLISEFSDHNILAVQLNNKYRAFKKDIHFCLGSSPDGFFQTGPIGKIFALRSKKIKSILKSKAKEIAINNGTASGFIHMFLNRLFISRSREQELVIYHYLYKYYKSIAESNKSAQKNTN